MIDHVKLGIELQSQPLQRDQRLEQQGEIGRQEQVVLPHQRGDVVEQRAHLHVLQLQVVVALQQFGHVVGQAILVTHRIATPVKQHLQQPLLVLTNEGVQEVDDLVAARLGEHAHHAEIDHADTVVRQEQHVSGMRVGVEVAVFQHHAQHGIRTACRQQLGIEPARAQFFRRRPGEADDLFLHVDVRAGVLPIHA